MAEIATAYVQIEPTAKGISGKISTMFGGEGESAGASFSGGFGKALGGLGKVAVGATAAVGAAVAGLGAKFVSGAGEVASYGDNIDKMSQKMGISAEAYQEWDAILQHSGSSMDSMARGMQTLQKNAVNSTKKFEALGLSEKQVAEMSTEELFAATIEGLQKMDEGAERTALASELLGGSAKELGALLNTSAEDTQAMRDRLHELGGVMSDDAVKAAAAYQDQLQDMQTAFQSLSRNMLSEFLPSITQVMSGLTDIFAGDTEGGLGKITEGVKTLADGLLSALPQLLDTGTKIVMALAQAILEALPTLIPVAVELALKFVDFLIQNAPLLIEAAAQLIVQLALGLASALPTLIPTIVDVVLTIVQYLIDNIDLLVDAAIQLMIGLSVGLIQALPILIEKIPEIVVALVEAIISNAPLILNAIIQVVTMLLQALGTYLEPIVTKVKDTMSRVIETVKTWLSQLPEKMAYYAGAAVAKFINFLMELPSKVSTIWNQLISNVKQFGQNFMNSAIEFAQGFGAKLINGLMELPGKLINVGHNIVEGLKEGIRQAWDNLTGWVGNLVDNLVKGFTDNLKIGSPSKVFRDDIGVWIPAGIAEGIEDGMGTIDKAMSDMTADIMPDQTSMVSSASYAPTAPAASPENQLYGLLARYLPIIAEGGNTNVVLNPNAQGLFDVVRQQNKIYKRMTGESALA
ncbi:MAG: hypothetical protein IKT30_06870 [Bacteroidaceae bacterium]|nr:hypothetical protein [Bacteroidaceae bacterium]